MKKRIIGTLTALVLLLAVTPFLQGNNFSWPRQVLQRVAALEDAVAALSGVSFAQTIIVAESGGDYDTFGAAFAAAAGVSTTNNRILILAYAGEYTEAPLTQPDYTTVVGLARHEAVRIYCSDPNSHCWTTGKDVDIVGIQVRDASGAGSACFHIPAGKEDVEFHDTKVRDCDIGWLNDSSGPGVFIRSSSVTGGSFTSIVKSSAGAETYVNGLHIDSGVTATHGLHADGAGAVIQVQASSVASPTVTNAIYAVNGGTVMASGFGAAGVANGVRVAANSEVILANAVFIGTSTSDITLEAASSYIQLSSVTVKHSKFIGLDVGESFGTTLSDTEDDQAFIVYAELNVGSPTDPKESVFGHGDSYTNGMLVLTTDGTAAVGADGGNLTDVSTEAATASGSTFAFQGKTAGHSILACSTLAAGSLLHYGWKVKQTTAATIDGAYIFEVWDGAAWAEVGVQANHSSAYLTYANDVFWRANSSEHLRFGIDGDTTWAQKTINGTNCYWARVRITTEPTTAPVFEQFKISPPRMELNSTGFLTAHGLAMWRPTIFGAGNIWGDGGLSSHTLPVGSGGDPTGWTHLSSNSKLDGAGDDLYWQVMIPNGLCTAYPIELRILYEWDNANPAGDESYVLSVLPIEVVGVEVADPAGGLDTVPRADGDTDLTTAVAATPDTFTPGGTVQSRVYSELRGPFDVSDYYPGDLVVFRFTMLDDGTNNTDLGILGVQVDGVQWNLGATLQ